MGHHTGFPELLSFECHTKHMKGSHHSCIVPGYYDGPGNAKENNFNTSEVDVSKGSFHTLPFDSS